MSAYVTLNKLFNQIISYFLTYQAGGKILRFELYEKYFQMYKIYQQV